MPTITKLIDGYKSFYQKYFIENDEVYKKLARDGQFPVATVIACSDSRADPALITGAEPGELFVIRNVANLVPPYQEDISTYHGTSAALEFAINNLKIKNVIVFGHSQCAGIKALIQSDDRHATNFVDSWMTIAKDVKNEIKHNHSELDLAGQAHMCEKKAIEKSLSNLLTFPWIRDKAERGEISLYGWHFDIVEGVLYGFNGEKNEWQKIK